MFSSQRYIRSIGCKCELTVNKQDQTHARLEWDGWIIDVTFD